MTHFYSHLLAITFSLLLVLPNSSAAKSSLPSELQNWQQWVLHDNKDYHCPFLFDQAAKVCSWRETLYLNADAGGLDFKQSISNYKDGWVAIPGNNKYWPQQVKRNQENARVRDSNGRPEIYLTKGRHHIKGRIDWNKIPRQLQLPVLTGLTHLTLNGQNISQPFIDAQRNIWLNKNALNSKKTSDSVQVKIFRLIDDTLPLQITTQLVLDISGRERELRLGQFLLDELTPIQLESPLPARIETDGDLRIQVKPGHWVINMRARHTGDADTLAYKARNLWPAQEIWSFRAQPQLRQVQIEGAVTIDPQQSQLPSAWRQLPSYLVTPQTRFNLKQQYRGDPHPSANRLNIKRDIWLDFDGTGYTLRDQISGVMNRDWRLNSQPQYQLGRVSINDEPQLITDIDARQGFEIRQSELSLEAISRLPRTADMTASGWQTDVDQLSARLHLAPGWSLITAKGADYARGSWLSKWNLWDIFLLLIIAVSTYRLCGLTAASCLFITLILTYQRDGAPLFIWLNLAATLALYKISKGVWKNRIKRYGYAGFATLLLITVPFSVDSVRQAFYPQLEHSNRIIANQQESLHQQNESSEEKYLVSAPAQQTTQDTVLMTSSPNRYSSKSNTAQYDPKRSIQTGPGIPNWRWNEINIGWNGPVKPQQTLQLTLTPPWLNRLGHIVSVVMIILSAALLLIRGGLMPSLSLSTLTKGKPRAASNITLLVLALGGSGISDTVVADVLIDAELLKTLQARLLEPAPCLPNCASIESGKIAITKNHLDINLTVHAAENIALNLPLPSKGWQAQQITVDKNNAEVTYNNRSKQWLVNLTQGRHQLRIQGSLKGLDELALPFKLSAHNITTSSHSWRIDGVQDGQIHSKSVQLTRTTASGQENGERLQSSAMPAFVRITRSLSLGLDWKLHTRVERISPAKGAIHLSIPLLAGESPARADLKLLDRQVQLSLGANQHSSSWQSILSRKNTDDTLTLQAPVHSKWVETWILQSAPIWHINIDGIAPIKAPQPSPNFIWQPRPGEQVKITASRPKASSGRELSIDQVTLKQALGQNSQTSELGMTLRASQGGEFTLPLPASAELRELRIDGIEQPITKVRGEIKIPLHPGEQKITAHWSSAKPLGLLSKSPALALGESSNNSVTITLPKDRWPLLVGGPAIGPAVLLWGMLAVVLLLSAALGRLQQTPLKTHHWLLLGIGMGSASVFAPLLITAWLLLLGWRGQWQQRPTDKRFRMQQVGILVLSAISVLSLLSTIPYGLLASPDMHIVGNGSSAYHLNWYQDLSQSALDPAWVISMPMWSYRLAMLMWSLWMAMALVQWLSWGWKQLNHLGFWPQQADQKTEITLDLELPETQDKQKGD